MIGLNYYWHVFQTLKTIPLATNLMILRCKNYFISKTSHHYQVRSLATIHYLSAEALNDLFPEWGQCQTSHFEMLFGKRNTNNGDAQNDTPNNMGKTNPNPANQNPDHIH